MSTPCIWAYRAAGTGTPSGVTTTGAWCLRVPISACCVCLSPSWRAPLSLCCSSASWSRPVRCFPFRVSVPPQPSPTCQSLIVTSVIRARAAQAAHCKSLARHLLATCSPLTSIRPLRATTMYSHCAKWLDSHYGVISIPSSCSFWISLFLPPQGFQLPLHWYPLLGWSPPIRKSWGTPEMISYPWPTRLS